MEKTGTPTQKAKRNVLYLTIGAIIFVLTVNIGLGAFLSQRKQSASEEKKASIVSEIKTADSFSYKGEEGKDALTLLKGETNVEQNSSGLVVSINGQKADDKKHEFWAFYVNGKMAEVGPAEYVTKDGEKVEWKIEHY